MWYKKKLPDDLGKKELEKLKAYVGQSNSDMNLVGQYENAIDILVNHIVDEGARVDLVAHPLLYLMRHSLELALKENIKYLNKYSSLGLRKIKTHTISDLFIEFERHYDKIANNLNFKMELESDYNEYVSVLNKLIQNLGTDWSSFRYIESMSGAKVFHHTEILNVYELKKQFDTSMVFLTHTVDVISPYTNYADYIKYDSTIKSKSLGYVRFRFPLYQKEWLIEKLNEKHKKSNGNNIWINEEENHNLHLKVANKECFIIPMKN